MHDLIALPAIVFLIALLAISQITASLPSPNHIEKPLAISDLTPTPSSTTPTITPTSIPTKTPALIAQPNPTPDTSPWGVAKQMTEHTWVIKVQNDPAMGSSDEILKALNDLRGRYGSQPLQKDSRLCAYAQKRADLFASLKNTDEHKGLLDFLKTDSGYDQLGFNWIGENSAYGYVMSGVHLIEFVYNSDPDHSRNQLDPKWDHGCVGVNSPATDLIFATSPR